MKSLISYTYICVTISFTLSLFLTFFQYYCKDSMIKDYYMQNFIALGKKTC